MVPAAEYLSFRVQRSCSVDVISTHHTHALANIYVVDPLIDKMESHSCTCAVHWALIALQNAWLGFG